MDVSITLDLTTQAQLEYAPYLKYVANPHFHIHARLPPHTQQRSLIAQIGRAHV